MAEDAVLSLCFCLFSLCKHSHHWWVNPSNNSSKKKNTTVLKSSTLMPLLTALPPPHFMIIRRSRFHLFMIWLSNHFGFTPSVVSLCLFIISLCSLKIFCCNPCSVRPSSSLSSVCHCAVNYRLCKIIYGACVFIIAYVALYLNLMCTPFDHCVTGHCMGSLLVLTCY